MKTKKTKTNEEDKLTNYEIGEVVMNVVSALPDHLVEKVINELNLRAKAHAIEAKIKEKAQKKGMPSSELIVSILEDFLSIDEAKEFDAKKVMCSAMERYSFGTSSCQGIFGSKGVGERKKAQTNKENSPKKNAQKELTKVEIGEFMPTNQESIELKEEAQRVVEQKLEALRIALKDLIKHNEKAQSKKDKVHVNYSSVELWAKHKNLLSKNDDLVAKEVAKELVAHKKKSIDEHNAKHDLVFQYNGRSKYYKEFLNPIKEAGKICTQKQ